MIKTWNANNRQIYINNELSDLPDSSSGYIITCHKDNHNTKIKVNERKVEKTLRNKLNENKM